MENNNDGIQKINWAIFCPGPSLLMHRSYKHDDGCSIAVNGAIARIPADYWAVCDEEVFVSAYKKGILSAIVNRTTLWIPAFWIDNADQRLPAAFHDFKREIWEWIDRGGLQRYVLRSGTWELKIGQGFPWREYTKFCAIALAIKKGAGVIRIYGDDMSGAGYCVEGFENDRTRHNEKRWEDERHWFKNIVALCAKHNIEIIRIPHA